MKNEIGIKAKKTTTSTQGRYGNRLSTSWLLLRGTGFSSAVACSCACVCARERGGKKKKKKSKK